MDSRNGFIVLPRKVFNDLSFSGDRFSRREAFIDLVQAAEYESKDVPVKGGRIHVEPGDLVCSIRTLAARWGWSTKTVLNTLKSFEKEGKLQRKIQHSICVISISCYSEFQANGNSKENATENSKENVFKQDNTSSSTNVDSEDIIKNKKKDSGTKVPSQKEAVERLYAIYPASVTRPEGNTVALRCKKDKERLERLLTNGHSEEELASTIRHYVSCTNKPYLKMFSTFLNNLPDYGDDNSVFGKPWKEKGQLYDIKDFTQHMTNGEYADIPLEVKGALTSRKSVMWDGNKFIVPNNG